MQSLFVLSLPRSLSTEVHRLCSAALALASPSWTTAGEIMNLDRFAMNAGRFSASPKYIQPRHGAIFDDALQFLDHVVLEQGFCYKDVTQPFVISSWFRTNRSRAALKIRPNIPHVAYAMMKRRWLYPTVASRQIGGEAVMMMEGLLLAEAALGAVAGADISFDELLEGHGALSAALARHAGVAKITLPDLPEDFERNRDAVLARRKEDAFRHLQDLECDMREQMAHRMEARLARGHERRAAVPELSV